MLGLNVNAIAGKTIVLALMLASACHAAAQDAKTP